jgi:hypothetical protein
MECGCIRLGANKTRVPVACSLRHRSLGLFWMESFIREILLKQWGRAASAPISYNAR